MIHAAETTTQGLMARLKAETAEMHDRAEHAPLQKQLAQGLAPKDAYVWYLVQLYHVHATLDDGLRKATAASALPKGVGEAREHQSNHLVEDLTFFHVCPAHRAPTPGAAALVEQIRIASASDPVRLLGFHYVTLGSTNGGRFIAKSLRKAYGLTDQGVRYFDPWGDEQRPLWMGFKAAMDAAAFTPAQMDGILDSAKAMFEGITRISEEVGSAHGLR